MPPPPPLRLLPRDPLNHVASVSEDDVEAVSDVDECCGPTRRPRKREAEYVMDGFRTAVHDDPFGSGFVWATGIEDTFIAQSGPRARRLDEYELVQHYQFWRQDIDFVASIGFDMMRYGIPWYRVEPAAGRFDWSWTDEVIPYLVDAGIEPIVDLVHYGTPLWLDHQFCHPDYPGRVAAYAHAFATRYRGLVRCYTPLNEPAVTALVCGALGRWPPALRGDGGFVSICNALCRGIVQTVQAIKAATDNAIIVHVEGTGFWVTEANASPETPSIESERLLTTLELLLGRVQQGHPLFGYLTANGVTNEDLDWYAGNRLEIDVLGINYYPDGSVHRRHSSSPEGIDPYWGGTEFLARAVREFSARFDIPLLISECAVNERSDKTFGLLPNTTKNRSESALREWWLEEVVRCLRALTVEGVPLVGFTWWPLLDTVSWDYRNGRGPVNDYLETGGLCALRTDNGSLQREALPVAHLMRSIIASWK